MTNRPPSYCPRCGSPVEDLTVEGHDHAHCPDCEGPVFHNPVPSASALVVDGDAVLLVRRSRPPDPGTWAIPGGHLETGETPREGAARELHEETGLRADPADLVLASDLYLGSRDGKHLVSFGYAVESDRCSGTPRAGSDAGDVAFVDATRLVQGDLDRPLLDKTVPRVRMALSALDARPGGRRAD